MNGKQRARWYADVISDLQRAQKQAAGHLDEELVRGAVAMLQGARTRALASSDGEKGDKDPRS